jgi:hypothetical protein
MFRKLAAALAATVAIAAALGPGGAASAAPLVEVGGDGFAGGLARHRGAAGRSGAAHRFGGTATRFGGGYAGTSLRYDALGSSGWHQGGWGGTLNPGIGYGFGPQLGGSGH